MELKARVNKEQFIRSYINIFNGGLGITNKEKDFLYEILNIYLELKEDNLVEPYLSKIVFSKESMKLIRNKLKISSQGINNYKAQLKAKGIIKENQGQLFLDPKIVPRESVTFKFEIV